MGARRLIMPASTAWVGTTGATAIPTKAHQRVPTSARSEETTTAGKLSQQPTMVLQ